MIFAPKASVVGALFETSNTPSITSFACAAFNIAWTEADDVATPSASTAATVPPCAVIVGLPWSTTIIVDWEIATFPAASVAVN